MANFFGGSGSSGGATLIDGLTDVIITSVANKDVLTYSTGAAAWVNAVPAMDVRADDDGTVVLQATDRGELVTAGHATANAVSIAQAGTAGFEAGYYVKFCTTGVGPSTITPATSTINNAATLVLQKNECATVISDGTNYRALLHKTTVVRGGNVTGGSPADSTTYYIGFVDIHNNTTWLAGRSVGAGTAGTVTRFCVALSVGTTLGTAAQTATIVLRKNDTTDSAESISLDYSVATPTPSCVNLTTAFTVAETDRLALKITTPAWTTNPTNVTYSWWALIS